MKHRQPKQRPCSKPNWVHHHVLYPLPEERLVLLNQRVQRKFLTKDYSHKQPESPAKLTHLKYHINIATKKNVLPANICVSCAKNSDPRKLNLLAIWPHPHCARHSAATPPTIESLIRNPQRLSTSCTPTPGSHSNTGHFSLLFLVGGVLIPYWPQTGLKRRSWWVYVYSSYPSGRGLMGRLESLNPTSLCRPRWLRRLRHTLLGSTSDFPIGSRHILVALTMLHRISRSQNIICTPRVRRAFCGSHLD